MKRLMIALWIVSMPAIAQETAEYRTCTASAKTQAELNVCANEEANRADSELNGLFRDLMSAVAEKKMIAEKVKSAERAWIAYRDAYVEAMYSTTNKQAEYV